MSEDTTETDTTEKTDPAESDTDTEEDPVKLRADIEKWKSLARKHERSAKDNSAAAKRLAEIEDATKSETQKLNDQLSAAQVELQTLRVEQIRHQAAREAGLDPDLAEYITAADPDEALAQAKRLAERLAAKAPKVADLRQGVRIPAKPAASADDWLRAATGH